MRSHLRRDSQHICAGTRPHICAGTRLLGFVQAVTCKAAEVDMHEWEVSQARDI